METLHQFLHACKLLFEADKAAAADLAPDKDVFHSVHRRDQIVFLIHDIDSEFLGKARRKLRIGLAVYRDGAAGRRIGA